MEKVPHQGDARVVDMTLLRERAERGEVQASASVCHGMTNVINWRRIG